MPPGRKPTRSREEFVAAAVDFADEHGLPALTLRALGQSMGASSTAVYRYFRDKDALIVALREHLLTSVVERIAEGSADPVQLLIDTGLAYRTAVRQHPCLSQIMGLPALEGEVSAALPEFVVAQLTRLGLHGPLLVRGYQQMESFVIGTASFDFSDAPRHLESRRLRLARLNRLDFTAELVDASAVERNNEAAFEASLRAIIAALLAEQAASVD